MHLPTVCQNRHLWRLQETHRPGWKNMSLRVQSVSCEKHTSAKDSDIMTKAVRTAATRFIMKSVEPTVNLRRQIRSTSSGNVSTKSKHSSTVRHHVRQRTLHHEGKKHTEVAENETIDASAEGRTTREPPATVLASVLTYPSATSSTLSNVRMSTPATNEPLLM